MLLNILLTNRHLNNAFIQGISLFYSYTIRDEKLACTGYVSLKLEKENFGRDYFTYCPLIIILI